MAFQSLVIGGGGGGLQQLKSMVTLDVVPAVIGCAVSWPTEIDPKSCRLLLGGRQKDWYTGTRTGTRTGVSVFNKDHYSEVVSSMSKPYIKINPIQHLFPDVYSQDKVWWTMYNFLFQRQSEHVVSQQRAQLRLLALPHQKA